MPTQLTSQGSSWSESTACFMCYKIKTCRKVIYQNSHKKHKRTVQLFWTRKSVGVRQNSINASDTNKKHVTKSWKLSHSNHKLPSLPAKIKNIQNIIYIEIEIMLLNKCKTAHCTNCNHWSCGFQLLINWWIAKHFNL